MRNCFTSNIDSNDVPSEATPRRHPEARPLLSHRRKAPDLNSGFNVRTFGGKESGRGARFAPRTPLPGICFSVAFEFPFDACPAVSFSKCTCEPGGDAP